MNMHEVDGVVWLSLAVSLAIKHFQHIVEGHSFYISLTTNICSVYLSPLRQIQYLDYISQFMSNICHIQRSCNAAADALFCIHLESNALLNSSPDSTAHGSSTTGHGNSTGHGRSNTGHRQRSSTGRILYEILDNICLQMI